MPITRKKQLPEGKIEKPEDKIWREEFEAMSKEQHEQALHQLGLDDADIEEWEETVGYKESPDPVENEVPDAENPAKKPKKRP